jgi:hypothetical protein
VPVADRHLTMTLAAAPPSAAAQGGGTATGTGAGNPGGDPRTPWQPPGGQRTDAGQPAATSAAQTLLSSLPSPAATRSARAGIDITA